MKIVISSDWHGDAITDGVRRFADVRHAVEISVEHAIRVGAAAYIMAGDLCDPNTVRAHRAVGYAASVARRLRGADIPPIFIRGNHDVIEDGSNDSVMEVLAQAGATVIQTPSSIAIHSRKQRLGPPTLQLVALPFAPASHGYDPAEEIERLGAETPHERRPPTIIVGHLNLEGIAPGSESTKFARGREVFWPLEAIEKYFPDALLIGGHYHRRQVYKGVQIVGSIARLRHDEEDCDPGFLVVEVDDGATQAAA